MRQIKILRKTSAAVLGILCLLKASAFASPADQPVGQGNFGIGINYPGAGIRYFFTDGFSLEAKGQFERDVQVSGLRGYGYIFPTRNLMPFAGLEASYTAFQGPRITGQGYLGEVFIGLEYFPWDRLSVQFDAGPTYTWLKDRSSAIVTDGLDFSVNFGINYYFGARSPAAAATFSKSPAAPVSFAAPPAREDDSPAIQKYLANLFLGDSLEKIEKVYPSAAEWPEHREQKGGVKRIRIERQNAKRFPAHVDLMWLSLKRDRLVEIQLVYDAAYTKDKSAEALAAELALVYGEAQRSGGRFWWTDGARVLRAMYAEVPVAPEEGEGTELRTSIQLMDAGLFHRKSTR